MPHSDFGTTSYENKIQVQTEPELTSKLHNADAVMINNNLNKDRKYLQILMINLALCLFSELSSKVTDVSKKS